VLVEQVKHLQLLVLQFRERVEVVVLQKILVEPKVRLEQGVVLLVSIMDFQVMQLQTQAVVVVEDIQVLEILVQVEVEL
tara:strand:+ start:179 stop:415 length:237 start_codon:yes stop_codon:yes gene_type:complete